MFKDRKHGTFQRESRIVDNDGIRRRFQRSDRTVGVLFITFCDRFGDFGKSLGIVTFTLLTQTASGTFFGSGGNKKFIFYKEETL